VILNQKKPPSSPPFSSLGTDRFAAGQTGWVEVRTDGTDGHVIADAVQWLPKAN